MKYRTLFILLAVSVGSFTSTAFADHHAEDWLPRFREQLDPASRARIVETAARYFRDREPLSPLWEVGLDEVATEEDIARLDLAIDHIITERSGVFHLPEKLPWYDAPKNFYTLSRFPDARLQHHQG